MIKINLEIVTARAVEQKELCYKVRHEVFINETGYLQKKNGGDLESDVYDKLDTTIHFLAYCEGQPAGTVRLILPNKQNARDKKTNFGLPMEELFDIRNYKSSNLSIAEISGSSVINKFKSTKTILYLWKVLMDFALSNGITDLVTNVNPETDMLCDAYILYDYLKLKNYVDNELIVEPRKPDIGRVRNFRFPLLQRICCNNNYNSEMLTNIKMPRTLKLFTKVGGLFTGEPVYSEKIDMCAMPMNLKLQHVEEILNTKFFRRDRTMKRKHSLHM